MLSAWFMDGITKVPRIPCLKESLALSQCCYILHAPLTWTRAFSVSQILRVAEFRFKKTCKVNMYLDRSGLNWTFTAA